MSPKKPFCSICQTRHWRSQGHAGDPLQELDSAALDQMPGIPGSVRKSAGRPRNETKGLPVSKNTLRQREWQARKRKLEEAHDD